MDGPSPPSEAGNPANSSIVRRATASSWPPAAAAAPTRRTARRRRDAFGSDIIVMLRFCPASLLERFERWVGEVGVGDDATALPLLLLVVATDGWLRADEEDDTAAVAASSRSRVELRRGPSRILCARSLSPVTLCLCVRVFVYFLAPAESDGAEDPLPRNRGLLALGLTCQRPTGPRAACVWWEEEGTQTRGPSQLGPWAARTAGQANASPV